MSIGVTFTFNVTSNNNLAVSDWHITGCTLSETVDAVYCTNNCGMCGHCSVGIERKKGLAKKKEKVQFT